MRPAFLRFSIAILVLVAGTVVSAAQEVTLPLPEFEQLRARALPEPQSPTKPPAPFALESAEVAIDVGVDSARVVETLELVIYAEGVQTVLVGEAGSFTAARLGDLGGSVDARPDGWLLVVHGRGRHRVTLESVVPLRRDDTATRPTWQMSLRFPPAGVVSGRIAAPAAVEEVELGGEGLLGRREGGSWGFVAGGGGAPTLFTLHGRRALPERAQLPLRFEATSATAVTLSRTRMRVRGWIEARVAQGRLEALSAPLPAGLTVVAVDGPVAGWKVADGALLVTPLEPVESSLAVEITLEGQPATAFASPLLVPRDSRRTLLLTRAALEGDGLLDLLDAGAARVAAAGEASALPSALGAGGTVFAVGDPARPPRFEVTWADKSEVLAAQVDRLLVDVAVGASQRAAYQLWAEVRNRGAQQLTLTLPAGFELVAGSRDGESVAAGDAGGGLVIPLAGGEAAQVIHVAGVLPLAMPSGGGELALPLPALSAPAARVEVRLLLPGGFTYTLDDPTRARAVGAPPDASAVSARRQAVSTSNVIAQQIRPPSGAASGARGLYPCPPGFTEVDAVWSALSPSPAPLEVRVRSSKESEPWF